MVDVAPFRALRYDPAVAGDPATTSAPAYSELERFLYAEHRTASPYTILELITRGPGTTFGAAAATYERWRRTGVLIEEPRPALFRYEEHELRHGVPAVQRGLLAAVALEPDGGAVRGHEDVQPDRLADRLDRLRAVPVDISPVFALHAGDSPALRDLLAGPPPTPPVIAFTDEAGIDHRVWRIDDPADIAALQVALRDVPVVIADGHHRYASAVAHSRERAGEGLPAGRTLMYLVNPDEGGPEVQPIHRLVRRWQPGAPGRLSRDFAIEEVDDALDALRRPDRGNGIVLGVRLPGGVGLLLRPKSDDALLARLPEGHSAAWRRLDTAVVDHAVLPALGATGVETRHDAAAAAAEVDSGAAAALFLVRAPEARTVLELATSGEHMPARTTWFRPKPRAGLVMRALDPPLPSTGGAPTVGE
jgi:uncharacterized protein (DUF1015 family)